VFLESSFLFHRKVSSYVPKCLLLKAASGEAPVRRKSSGSAVKQQRGIFTAWYPFETFSRFAVQMTIPCFTATRLGSGEVIYKSGLSFVVCASATSDPWVRGTSLAVCALLRTTRPSTRVRSFPFSRIVIRQCCVRWPKRTIHAAFLLPLPFPAITHVKSRLIYGSLSLVAVAGDHDRGRAVPFIISYVDRVRYQCFSINMERDAIASSIFQTFSYTRNEKEMKYFYYSNYLTFQLV